MADVKDLKDKGLPLKIDGATRFVKGATKYTTCADVIKMVLKKTGIGKEYRHLFVIYEISRDGEKALSAKSRILKIAKAWTGERNKFVLRKTDVLETVSVATSSSSDALKAKKPKKAEKKLLSKLTNVLKSKHAPGKHKENNDERIVSAHSDLCETTSDSDSSLDEFMTDVDKSKMAEFIKFFNAMATLEEKRSRKRKIAAPEVLPEEVRGHTQLKSCKKSRRRSRTRSRPRCRPASDMHPSKMHSVQRLDYGFIDNLKTMEIRQATATEDAISNIHSFEHAHNNFQRQTYTVKRYWQNRPKSHNTVDSANNNHADNLAASEVQDMLAQSFKLTATGSAFQPKCHEIWNEDFRRENVSGPDSVSSDDSLDHDSVRSYFKRVESQGVDIESEDIIRNNKLVDYSMTDDELSEIETDDEELNRNVRDFGYSTGDTSFSANFSKDCEQIKSSFSGYGYHDNQAYTSSFETDQSLFSLSEDSGQIKSTPIVNSSDFIRSLFDKAHAQTEDEEMDSFMTSKIFDDSFEEGFSFLQSEGETDL